MHDVLGEQAAGAIENGPGGIGVPLEQPICEVPVSSSYVDEGKGPAGETGIEDGFNQLPFPLADVFDIEVFDLVLLEDPRLAGNASAWNPPRRRVAVFCPN